MPRWSGGQIQQLAKTRGMQARMELNALSQERKNAAAAKKQLDGELDKAWAAFAAALVPSLSMQVLDARAAGLGLPVIAAANVKAQHDAYVDKQRRAIAAIDADPVWQQRESLDNAAQIKIAELDDAIAPLRGSVEALEAEPYFAELVRVGYGTDAYPGRFWQLSYYRHWKNADLVVAKHGARLKCESFGDIRAKYLNEREALTSLLDEKRIQDRNRDGIAQRVTSREQAEKNLASVAERVLVAVRGAVQAHVRPLQKEDLAKLVAGDTASEVGLKRVVGTEKKREYLDAMEQNWLTGPAADLQRLADKAAKVEAKYGRQKNWSRSFDVDTDRMFPDKSQSWVKRRQRFSTGSSRILGFNDWNRAPSNWYGRDDFLWWDMFVADSVDGSFIPEVALWRERQQNLGLRRELDDEYRREAAAAAVADAQQRRDDAQLSSDVS